MANTWFRFRQFTIEQDRCAMKVTTDACLFGAWAAEQLKQEKFLSGQCLDIGTGTGLLSLMLAQAIPLQVDAIEKDPEAAVQAAANVEAGPWSSRIRVIQADVTRFSFAKKYDVIISNPPFYERELKSGDPKKNQAHHDAGLTWASLLPLLRTLLAPGGRFFLLAPFKRYPEIVQQIRAHELHIRRACMIRQTPQHAYFRVFITGSNEPPQSPAVQDEISITGTDQPYSDPFIRLLKDYYLHL